MQHIVIVTPGFPVNEDDSICVPFLQIYLKELIQNKNITLTVITQQYPARENYFWHGIPVITLQKKEPLFISKVLRYARLRKTLRQIHKQNKITVIHNFWFSKGALVTSAFCVKNKIKHITTFCGQDVLPTNKALKKTERYKGDLICLCRFQSEKLPANVQATIRIIPHGIERIEPSAVEKTIDLIFCGWITELKNYNQFVDIVHVLSQQGLLNKVLICGGGADIDKLKNRIKELSLQSLIDVKGETNRKEVLDYMSRSKILVHTSGFEGFGLVLIEGLASGCTVISKPVGVACEISAIRKCTTTNEFVAEIKTQLAEAEKNQQEKPTYLVETMVARYLERYIS